VPDRELEGTTWVLTTIVTGDSASSVIGESPLTLTIADGKLHARACNSINGDVTVDGGTLAVGPLASTRMACPSEEETIQEGAYLAGLESASAFEISGDTLTVTTADGAFQFTAEDA
jgi:heat shock protein HslJ